MKTLFLSLILSLCLILLTGCETQRRQLTEFKEDTLTPSYLPSNTTHIKIPDNIQRVTLLPIMNESIDANTLKALNKILYTECNKTALFDLVTYPESKQNLELSTQLLSRIYEETQSDAILIPEITTYRTQQPIAIGLKLTLIETQTTNTLWAFDETFDAGLSTVHYGAKRYAQSALKASYPFTEEQSILMSPRLFFQYASYEAFKTIY